MKPRPPESLDLAAIDDHDLEDEATYRRLEFSGMDLSGGSAESVEFEQCRFRANVDLSGTTLARAMFTDCLVENSNLANRSIRGLCLQPGVPCRGGDDTGLAAGGGGRAFGRADAKDAR